ncbi:aminopeptidase N-like isoform X2 [Lytechinus variegatus]|uniref:aminopeptidase N-like isoform X2 n=1 Tax=Lytechinus variegatus TaxID=7654 RepID=UPI001BB19A57|nr:aminopeptidase N-like isoform X2 [Lytechinus variegatus]
MAGSATQPTENSMAMDGKFEIDEEGGPKKSSGYYCTTGQLLFLAIVGAGIIAGVGCMAYYLPDRSCELPPTEEPGKVTEPQVQPTEPRVTEPPVTEPHATEPRATTHMMSPTPTDGIWDGRLPRDLIPENYQLYLKPYLYDEDLRPNTDDRRFTFDGRVKIVMECKMDTDVITLHINNITIRSHSLESKNGDMIDVTHVSYTPEYQFVHFHPATMLKEGTGYVLEIEYLGELWDGLAGFYRSSYTEGNETRWLATTQMQPTDARRALPCFDEPDLRAIFYTEIEHRKDMVALSNGIEEGERDGSNTGWMITNYRATPKMSTYLLAFVVGYFDKTEMYTENDVRFRVWSRPEAVESTRYALDIGANITTYFEKYFDTPFPLSKQDMIAVPDFSAGAMENWGLIIYRETALLYDDKVNSASNKQRVAVVVSHELAHQWFGNLVTPIWWDDLWLNEGFASYVEYLGVDYVEPDWGMREQFVVVDLQSVFEPDSLGTSHPVRVPVNSPDEINEIFDSISYSKGASIIRMLNNFLGEEVFVDGLSYYLNSHKESNADSDDLWFALKEADVGKGNNDVKAIMDTWTLQMGYPVVDLRRHGANQLNASQEHFLVNPEAGVDDKYIDLGYLWYVYLTYTQKTGADFTTPHYTWIEKEPWALVNLSSSMAADDWYLANIQQFGFYRVNYDNENWARLSQQLVQNHTVLPNENRAQLINDAFSLARVGRVDYPIALNITLYMDKEMDYIPWEAALGVISYITDMFSRYSGYGPLERYMRKQVENLYNSLGWEDDPVNDPHLTQYNRINAVGTSCRYRNQDCLDYASDLYHMYMENDANNTANLPDYEINPITPNLKTTVYCYGIQEGGQEEWDFGWKKYGDTNDAAEQNKWLYALACSQSPWILSRYLDYSLDQNYLRKQDSSYVIRYVSQNYIGRSLAWDFLRNEWDTVYDYYGNSFFVMRLIIQAVTKYMNTPGELQMVRDFKVGRDFGSSTRTMEQAEDLIQANIWWMDNNAAIVEQWLRSQPGE